MIRLFFTICFAFSCSLAFATSGQGGNATAATTTEAAPTAPVPPSASAPAVPQPLPVIAVKPPQPVLTPTAPTIRAKGYVLMDANSGKVLVAQNADQRMPPASLTKIMTSYLVSAALSQGRIHLDNPVFISEKAWRTGGSKMFVKIGDQVPVRDLLQGIIVASGNDACVAMAEHLAGSEESFASMMNQQAAALGMKNSHFTDANGLPDPNHYTTPYDMALLARALILNFPGDYQWYSQKEFTYNNIKQLNRNRLLWRDATVDGVKTGHTDDAGFCLVASAKRDGMRLIAVVMGAPSDAIRADDTQKLLNYGFRFFESRNLIAANVPIKEVRVWLGQNKMIKAGVLQDLYAVVPVGQSAGIKTEITVNGAIKAPVNKGDILGTIQLSINNEPLMTQPLVALEDDAKAGFFSRLIEYIRLGFHKLFGGQS